MTVAAGIEIAIGGLPEPAQAQVHERGAARVQGKAWGASAFTGAASSSAPGVRSFRDGWQTLLASLGANGGILIEPEPATKGQEAPAESALAGLPGEAIDPDPATTQIAVLPPAPSGAQAKNRPANSSQQIPVRNQAAAPVWVERPTGLPQRGVKARTNSPNVASPAPSAASHRAGSTERGQKQETSSVEDDRAKASPPIGQVVQPIVPPSGTAVPTGTFVFRGATAQPASLAASVPTVPAVDSFNLHSQPSDPHRAEGCFRAPGSQTTDASSYQGLAHAPDETPVAIAANELGAPHRLQPAGFSQSAEGEADGEIHLPDIATGAQHASKMAKDNLQTSVIGTALGADSTNLTRIRKAPLSFGLPVAAWRDKVARPAADTEPNLPTILNGSPSTKALRKGNTHAYAGKTTQAVNSTGGKGIRTARLNSRRPAAVGFNKSVEATAGTDPNRSMTGIGSPYAQTPLEEELAASIGGDVEGWEFDSGNGNANLAAAPRAIATYWVGRGRGSQGRH